MKVTILHPDLGIGGAERLVVDAARAFRDRGHHVRIVTNQFSRSHCFEDMKDFFEDVTVIGGFPRAFFGKFFALCAYIRICFAAIFICLYQRDTDVIFCDQISAPLFLLQMFLPNATLVFYCHYPDQLLTTRASMGKRLYRAVLDRVECWTTGLAHVLFVNSRFTESVFRQQFPSLSNKSINILYPSLNVNRIDQLLARCENESGSKILDRTENRSKIKKRDLFNEEENYSTNDVNIDGSYINDEKVTKSFTKSVDDLIPTQFQHVFLSVNRFEVKKNIELAIHAFAMLQERLTSDEFSKCALVIAGGYDLLNKENILHHQYLKKLTNELKLTKSVIFILSPNDEMKFRLFLRASLVIYTPLNEHFGIVPLEAMYMRRSVLATSSGGPLETILDGKTGYLRASEPLSFCEAMLDSISGDTKRIHEMGERGRQRVLDQFSFEAFTDQLNEIVFRRLDAVG